MKTLKDYITSLQEASLLDIEGTLDSGKEVIKKSIKDWIKDNFKVASLKISKNPNSNGKYEVSAKYVNVTNKNITSLTNDLFVWKEIKEYFDCSYCKYLKSLKDAPEKINGCFYCTFCDNLISLEGAPKEVGGDFNCPSCSSLTSLKGAPDKVGGNFRCRNCKCLISLDGAPNYVGGHFSCSGGDNLTSIEGAPKEIGGNFHCSNCDSLISKDLPTTTKIKGAIFR